MNWRTRLREARDAVKIADWRAAAAGFVEAAELASDEDDPGHAVSALVGAARALAELGDHDASFQALATAAARVRSCGAVGDVGVYCLRDYGAELALKARYRESIEAFNNAVKLAAHDGDLEGQTAAIAAAHLLTPEAASDALRLADLAIERDSSRSSSKYCACLVLAGQALLLLQQAHEALARFQAARRILENSGRVGVIEEVDDWIRRAELRIEGRAD